MSAVPAQALSCLPYGLPHAIYEVATAEEGYVSATGVLLFDENRLPKMDIKRQEQTPPMTKVPARFKGLALTKNGFTQSFETRLTLEVACYGPWCASAQSGKQVLVFLKKTNAGYALGANPCGDHIFYDPTQAALDQVERCYLKGHCPKPRLP